MDYMVSSHGGRHNNTGTIAVPAGITVKFFVHDGGILTNDNFQDSNAWGIYNHLKAGLALQGNIDYINARVVETVNAGNQVYNYSCWNMQDINCAAYSGIYPVGSSNPINNLPNPLTLADVFQLIAGNTPSTIYWVACREVS